MHLFYTPDIHTDVHTLDEEESKHCIRVLRLGKGDIVHLIDGKGGWYKALIADPHPKQTLLNVVDVQREVGKRRHFLHIAVAPTKNIERLEWFLEKSTELGIDEITPVICDRSERRDVKTERLVKIITSAVKQSLKAYHPVLNPAIKFKDFVERQFKGEKYIAHCIEEQKTSLKNEIEHGSRYLILIGPEGDFTSAEVDIAKQHGHIPISLGESRLRTETAALEACFEINYLNR